MNNKKIIYFFSGLIIILLIISAILKLITPKQVIIPASNQINQNLVGTTTNFEKIIFNGSIPSFNQNYKIYRFHAANLSQTSIIDSLIKAYSLQPHPKLKNIWQNNQYSLTVNKNNLISLNNNINHSQKIGLTNQQQYVDEAKKIIKNVFPNLNLQIINEEIVYLTGKMEYQITDKLEESTAIQIPFSYSLDGLNLYYANMPDFPFQILLDTNLELVKLSFYPLFIVPIEFGQKNLISIDQAITNINNNRAAIISGIQNSYTPVDWSQIVSGELTKVSLEYRLDEEYQMIYPYYRFVGNLQTANNTNLEAQVITPAVEVKY